VAKVVAFEVFGGKDKVVWVNVREGGVCEFPDAIVVEAKVVDAIPCFDVSLAISWRRRKKSATQCLFGSFFTSCLTSIGDATHNLSVGY